MVSSFKRGGGAWSGTGRDTFYRPVPGDPRSALDDNGNALALADVDSIWLEPTMGDPIVMCRMKDKSTRRIPAKSFDEIEWL